MKKRGGETWASSWKGGTADLPSETPEESHFYRGVDDEKV